jgi:peptidyl-prolyl cis-trans isomerase A (cyclophilin A)
LKIVAILLTYCLLGITGLMISSSSAISSSPVNPHVLMITEAGDIEIEIFIDKAPVTAGNFLEYVKQNLFRNAFFYRVVTTDNQPDKKIKIEVIQGGLGFEDSLPRLGPIEHETTLQTGIKHLDGTISMARDQPGSASSEFFICINDQPELDFGGKRNPDGQGFAAFGKVTRGMDVVRKIQLQPNSGQMLDKVVKIMEIKILNP